MEVSLIINHVITSLSTHCLDGCDEQRFRFA